jgi:hypothetical protein
MTANQLATVGGRISRIQPPILWEGGRTKHALVLFGLYRTCSIALYFHSFSRDMGLDNAKIIVDERKRDYGRRKY